MRSEVRLNSAMFQLTPTRTRCDLVITANGKTEKIASGLVNPFLSHLKTAQEQIAKGGYSIKLEPDPATEAAWFTKATLERFVRFVSTPEVLERVNTIESEILQIEEAISIQGNDNLALNALEDHQQIKSTGSNEGNKPIFDTDVDKALVIYKPGPHPTPIESNGSKMNEENSKVQLLRVLESRKKVLQKEQAMAFARATAASFDIENITHLISFAESFGASRLREACIRYMQLWKGKHETGQWIEVEAAEALSYRSEYAPSVNSGIILSGDSMKPTEFIEAWPVSGGDISSESNVGAGTQVKGEFNGLSPDNDKDKRKSLDHHVPHSPSEYYQGHVQQPPFPQWTMHSQPGPHIYQPYAMQPMPYYQGYPGSGQFFQPSYPPIEDPRFTNYNRNGKKKNYNNDKDRISDSEDGTDQSGSGCEEETSRGRTSSQKAGRSRKKKGVVVIRNLNYIAGKGNGIVGNGSDSTTESEIEENKDSISDSGERKQRFSKSSKTKDFHNKSWETSDAHGKDEGLNFQEADAGNWQAFQSFLLRAEEKLNSAAEGDIFSGENEPPAKKGQNKGGLDPILLERIPANNSREKNMEFDAINGQVSRTKRSVSNDELLVSSEGKGLVDSQTVAQFTEIEGGVGGYRKAPNDAFIMDGREKQMDSKISADPIVDCEHEHGGYSEKSSSYLVIDDSFMVSVRSGSQHELGADQRVIVDLDSEFLSAHIKEDSSIQEDTKFSYVPDDLTLMLDNTRESESIGFDLAIDYDIQVPLLVKQEAEREDDVSTSTKEGIKKTDQDNKLKCPQDGLQKKRKDAMTRKMSSLRSTPLIEAQKRAEKLRNYKADLQKQKKEQEDEKIRRLEALKRERQQRIAARSGSNGVHSTGNLQQPKPSFPVKVSASTYKITKFMDTETGSPLQKMPRRSSSIVSHNSSHVTKTTKSNELSRSESSLPELKKENKKQEENSASVANRRLSETKGSTVCSAPSKSTSTNQVRKKPLAEEPQSKKISAIIQLDKTKSAMLPELKIKAYRTPSQEVQDKAATKQHRRSGSRTTFISDNNHANRSEEKASTYTCTDENPVIEKTVVVLENEAVHASSMVQTYVGKTDSVDKSCREVERESYGEDTGIAAVHAPPSPVDAAEIKNPGEGSQGDRSNSYEIENDFSKDEFQKFLLPTVTDKPYQASLARASSMEIYASGIKTIKADASDVPNLSSLDQMNETQEKPRHKESKGLRKLWKLGRRSHASTSGDVGVDSDGSVVEDHMEATSNDNSTLKNIISQDETHRGGTPPKVSRPFSILSPFRGRTNEKKIAG